MSTKAELTAKGIQQVTVARGRIALYGGFWMPLAAKLQWVADPDVAKHGAVAMVDGVSVWYDPVEFGRRPQGEVTFIVIHEIMHPMLSHMCRMMGRDPMKWNDAIDATGNELLIRYFATNKPLGATLPADAVTYDTLPKMYEGLRLPADAKLYAAEKLYTLLNQAKRRGGSGGDVRLDLVLPPPPAGDTGDDQGKDKGKAPRPGSAGVAPQPQQDEMARDWTLAMQSAAVMAKEAGKLPQFLEEWIAELIKPHIDWRSQLRHAVSATAKDDQSWQRFARRHIWRGAYLPGMYSERIRKLVYAIDTSGSIGSDEFKAGMGCMTDIIEEMRPDEIIMLQCDSKLHRADSFTSYDLPLPKLKVYGRGGTDMNPVFEWVKEHETEIDAVIMQTDGLLSRAIEQVLIPQIPTIWVLTRPNEQYATFGTVVQIQL